MKTASPLSFQELFDILPDSISTIDRELIHRAYKTSENAHEGQKRVSGEPYMNHCLSVATILVELGMPAEVIAAALLHDTVEDTTITLTDLKRDFGDTVANLVDGVTKLSHLPRVSRAGEEKDDNEPVNNTFSPSQARDRKHELTIETLRKTFLAMGEDVRVILIKLADRLHNMRTLGYFNDVKRKRIAQETLDIFAPLANRLGIWQLKWELEDLAFRYAQPEKYKEIAEQLQERRETRESEVRQIIQALTKILAENNIEGEITGRPKHIYSIYKKMIEKGKPFELVRDIRAVRIIVPDVPSCYATLGIIHTHWRPLPNEFDDYIAAPKDNFYQSLHTVVIYDDGKPIEVQIRTSEMDRSAEFGIAAHWIYKEGGQPAKYDERINWLRKMMEWRSDVDDAQEFVDGMKTDVFRDRVYVFTPRGDIIDLPSGSTPIDFAYHVHTDVGHFCRGAKINGKLVPLDYELKTGDQVEVLTSKQGGPSRDWLNSSLGLIKTQRARSKIRAWFKKQNRDQNEIQGKNMLSREVIRLGMKEPEEKTLQVLASKLNRTLDELYVSLGTGDITVAKTLNLLLEGKEDEDSLVVVPSTAEQSGSDAVTVLGLKDLLTNFAKCCNPTPGDDIIGYITRGRGATVHRMDCPNVMRIRDRERLIKVSWGEKIRTYPVSIRISAYDRQGLMGDLSNLLESESVNIVDVHVRVSKNIAELSLIIEVKDIVQLSRILSRMENIPNVLEAQRIKGG